MTDTRRIAVVNKWFSVPGEKKPGILIHATVIMLLVGMVMALLLVARSGGSLPLARMLGIILAASAALSAVLVLRGTRRGRLPLLLTILAALITFSGVPGIFYTQSDAPGPGLAFFAALLLRNYICFYAIPVTADAGKGRLERVLLWWALVACFLAAASTFFLAQQGGVSLNSDDNLKDSVAPEWLNPNTTGVFCAFCILLSVISTFVPLLIRVGTGLVGAYVLVLSQSRTSVVALMVSVLMFLWLIGARHKLVAGLAVAAVLITAFAISDDLGNFLSTIPQLERFSQKFQSSDPRVNDENTTRMDVIYPALERFAESPVIGYGYEGENTRFENGYLSMACESGSIGLLLYLAFVGLVIRRTAWLLRAGGTQRSRELGIYLACITTFILVHSLGERSHGFTIAYTVSNVWAIMIAISYTIPSGPSGIVFSMGKAEADPQLAPSTIAAR